MTAVILKYFMVTYLRREGYTRRSTARLQFKRHICDIFSTFMASFIELPRLYAQSSIRINSMLVQVIRYYAF